MTTAAQFPPIDPVGEKKGWFEVQPLFSSELADAASFIHEWRSQGTKQSVPENLASIERRLRWLLIDNPVAAKEDPLGYCVRDGNGIIRGVNLCFPSAFSAGDQQIFGLCSGSFFVEPAVRSMGFYLFKRYVSAPGYAFFFATTCNSNSEPIWKMMGGRAVPDSETEYIVPLRLDVMIPAYVASKTSSDIASGVARIAGKCANSIFRFPSPPSTGLTIEHCQDWEKLSALFRRHRAFNSITSDRSPDILRWRYGPDSPLHPSDIFLFRDPQGNEGWFCLSNLIRGDVHGLFLLDAVWPRDKISFATVFQEILRLASGGADALFFRRRPGLEYREYCRWAIPHAVEARAFVISPRCALDLNSLDYDDNDYVAWMFHWNNHAVQ